MRSSPPLCVDLDGTLIRSDLLLESFLLLIKKNPLYLLVVPFWLMQGKAALKAHIARRVALDASTLPYCEPLLGWLKEEKARGRQLWLCTASDASAAHAVAQHLKLFDGVVSSDGVANMSGRRKAAALVERFGDKGFDYCGNEMVDVAVWQQARAAVVVNAGASVEAAARGVTTVDKVFAEQIPRLKSVFKALRVHQWAKNGLIFVPLAAAHQLTNPEALGASLLAFMAFSLCASSVYLLNDMLDLQADRQHHNKRKRPFAAGHLSLLFGLFMAPALLVLALGLACLLPWKFMAVLAAYYVATLAYSFGLKKLVMIDVLALAGLYTVRIVAGAAATGIPLSFWLLLFAIFIFLSLAMVKRYAELLAMKKQGKLKASGRGYQVEDLGLLQSLGSASGYISILVLALYVNSPDISVLYHHPKLVWLLCPIMLYWVSRIWMQTHRGRMHDDPLVFALKDRVSLVTGAAAALVMWSAM
jgi:4-hydroxybenzoate polyprenyltransferase